ncbi:hypothetical protein LTS17_001471 [Exophiala oligosperma]
MVGQFGGPCFDAISNQWTASLQVEADGSIEIDDEIVKQLRHLAPEREQIPPALDHVGQLAKQVTGRIFITVLRPRDDGMSKSVDDLVEHEHAMMSGFWLDKTKFVTCAHFLNTIPFTNVDETEKYLKVTNPARPRALVSNKRRASGVTQSGPEVWPVYLVSLSRSSGIAVFELSQAAVTSGNYPPHSVPSSALSSSLTEPTTNTSGRSFKDTDQSYLRLFAAYYPANNILVERTDLSPKRKEFARQANIPFAWDLWCEERSNLDPAAAKNPGDFSRTFNPHCRSVAFGQLQSDHRGNPGHGNSDFAQIRECNLVGTYGCSGGMVCHLYREAGSWRSVVVGIFHGESSNDPRYNGIVAFKQQFVQAIQKGTF